MEIKIPSFTAYRKKIISGEISVIRVPFFPVKKGDCVKAVIKDDSNKTLLLFKVKSITSVPLMSITPDEARAEGFTLPDFCHMKEICRNIELRLDIDSALETRSGSVSHCDDCLLRKDAKELFHLWWNIAYGTIPAADVLKLEIEVLSKSIGA